MKETPKRIWIRADGNPQIGMGHVMRCLSIADAITTRGGKVCFVTACKECCPVIEQRGHAVELLPTDYRQMEAELEHFKALLAGASAAEACKEVILVDSYQVTEAYFRELSTLGKVACLEDMGISYPVDLLINYNLYGPELAYAKEQERPCELCLGTTYLPLRQEFLEQMQYQVRDEVTDVLITTGGSDPHLAAVAFTDAFLQQEELRQKQIRYHIVIGPFHTQAQEVRAHYQTEPQVVLHENVSSMKELMRQCDVVLTATGSTIYEVSALGVPMIVFYFAENQRQGAEMLPRITHVINCGNLLQSREETIKAAQEALLCCVKEPDYRVLLHTEEKQLVDGKGADRLAQRLFQLADRM